MLLALRALPFFITAVAAIGTMALFWFPTRPFLVIGVTLVLLFFLLARLVGLSFRQSFITIRDKTKKVWSFLVLPFCLSVAAFSLLLFVEGRSMKVLIIVLTVFLLWLFTENIFAFLYLPGIYHVNALEYLSLVTGVVSVFFLASALFALRLFFGFPLWVIVPIHAVFILAVSSSVLWICKIEKEKILPNVWGAVLLSSELFLCLAFLPTSFFSNAAMLTLFFYLFFGIIRAHLLRRLNQTVLRRYLLAACLISAVVIFTARWT